MSNHPSLLIAGLALSLAATSPLSAQPLRYDAPAEPVLYQAHDPWLVYWLRSARDTVGQPVAAFAVERWDWSRQAGALQVVIRTAALDTQRGEGTDTFALDSTGRVSAVNQGDDAARGRWDLLPYLPAGGAATVGATWTDAISFGGAIDPSGQRYEARRVYRVERIFDSTGVALAEISIRGDVRYRDRSWADSAAGTVRWLDVRGPVNERVLVSLADGVLRLRRWEMDLRGVGGNPEIPRDSVRAGLRSSSTRRAVSPDRYALLSRPFEGSDTTYTVLGRELLFLHVAGATPQQVTSGVARADGWTGTATSTFAAGAPRSHQAIWTSHEDSIVRLDVATRGDSLLVSGSRTQAYPVPAHAWGVADHGMTEHLVPALLALARTRTFEPFAVFRPYLAEWDTGTVRVTQLEEGLLAEIVLGDGASQSVAIFSEEGALLYAEGGYDEPSFRVPRPGTEARARIDRILERLQQQGAGDADR